jgi:hypothetical protein
VRLLLALTLSRKGGAMEQSGTRSTHFASPESRAGSATKLGANIAPLLRGEVGSRGDPGEGLLNGRPMLFYFISAYPR